MIIESTANELRKTGISVVGDVRWGTHFCCFYETKQDLLDTLVLYFKAGLESKEFCLWVISQPLTVEEAKRALRQAVPDLDRRLAEGDLEIHGHDEWYLCNGQCDPQRILQSWREKLNQALAKGYAGLRASGDGGWTHKDEWMVFREYEKELDALVADQRRIILCTYPLTTSPGHQVFDLACIHQVAVARRNGRWETVETPELKQAKAEIKRLNDELEQRVIERTKKLEETTERLRAEIEDRKEAEEALRQSEERFAAFMDNLPGYAWMKDLQGRYVYVNEMVRELPGYRSLGKTDAQIWPADLAAEYRANDQQVIAAKKPLATLEHYQQEGKQRYMAGSKFPIFDKTGAVALVGGAGVDITERIEAEEVLRESEAHLRKVLDSMFAFTTLFSTDGVVLESNRAWREVAGWQRENIIGKCLFETIWWSFQSGQTQERIRDGLRRAAQGETVRQDLEICSSKDESIIVVDHIAGPLRDAAGRVIEIVCFGVDATERKQAAKKLEEVNHQLRFLSRRLFQIQEEERRHLARELHDEIGQTLTAARINTDMLRAAIPPNLAPRLNENAAILDRLLQQTRQISLDLRPPLLDDLGLIPALRWYVDQQAERAGLQAKFSADLHADDVPPQIQIACFRLAQEAITNVVRHGHAKTLTVELRRSGSSLRLIVHDDGKGFDVAAAEARAEQGASLGLLGIKERAALAGGSARITSSSGQGTTIEVLLPSTPSGADANHDPAP